MKREILGIILITALIISGCGGSGKNESKNMEQIYTESGIPVKVMEMNPVMFKQELPFTATITGLKQADASAMIGGIIEKIHVKVGDQVQKDQVLMEFPEDTPAGQLIQARSAYELAEATYDRMKNLFDLGGIARQELDGVETQYKVAKANLNAAMQMLKIRAPISGYVTSVNVRETDGVKFETILATVSQTDTMKAKVWVTENEVCQITAGQEAEFRWNDLVMKGSVTTVSMAMDPDNNAFGVDLVFANPNNICKSGVIGDILITTYVNRKAFTIPRKNVMKDEKGLYVFAVIDDKAEKRYIETGKDNGSYEVISGVNTGDKVIIEGLNLVSEGAKVRVVE